MYQHPGEEKCYLVVLAHVLGFTLTPKPITSQGMRVTE